MSLCFYRYIEIVAAKTVRHLHVHMHKCGHWFRQKQYNMPIQTGFPRRVRRRSFQTYERDSSHPDCPLSSYQSAPNGQSVSSLWSKHKHTDTFPAINTAQTRRRVHKKRSGVKTLASVNDIRRY